jgi:hypothetical protein
VSRLSLYEAKERLPQPHRATKAPELKLESYILSVLRYKDISKAFDDGNRPKEEFKKNHILFMEDSDFIKKLFRGA